MNSRVWVQTLHIHKSDLFSGLALGQLLEDELWALEYDAF